MRIVLEKGRSWSAVPDDILEDKRLSFPARVVLGYCLGRPAVWSFYVSHLCNVLGLRTAQWRAAARNLKQVGYLEQRRGKDESGRWTWEMVIHDQPTIVHFSNDGEPVDGGPIDGQVHHITEHCKHKTKTKKKEAAAPGQEEVALGIFVENSADLAGIKSLVKKFGEAEVAGAAVEAGPAPGRAGAFLSSVKKLLLDGERASRKALAEADARAARDTRTAPPTSPPKASPARAATGLAAAKAALRGRVTA